MNFQQTPNPPNPNSPNPKPLSLIISNGIRHRSLIFKQHKATKKVIRSSSPSRPQNLNPRVPNILQKRENSSSDP